MAARYTIELTDVAEAVYNRLADDADNCIRAGDLNNSKITLFCTVEEAVDKIIPHDPFNRDRTLSGPLSNIFRIKKGRLRICYIGSSRLRRITVLYISDTPRKEGDAHDPYAQLTRLVSSGRFDALFDVLGVKRPRRRRPTRFPLAPGPRRSRAPG